MSVACGYLSLITHLVAGCTPTFAQVYDTNLRQHAASTEEMSAAEARDLFRGAHLATLHEAMIDCPVEQQQQRQQQKPSASNRPVVGACRRRSGRVRSSSSRRAASPLPRLRRRTRGVPRVVPLVREVPRVAGLLGRSGRTEGVRGRMIRPTWLRRRGVCRSLVCSRPRPPFPLPLDTVSRALYRRRYLGPV